MTKEEKEVEIPAQNFAIDPKNYAEDLDLGPRALAFMKSISEDVRSKRNPLNSKYLEYYNIFRCRFDTRYYNGVSEVYIPQLRKNVDNYVSRLKHALFPTDDVFDVEPTDPEGADQAEAVYSYMRYQIDKKIKVKAKIDRFLRQLVMYGWSPVKCVFERVEKDIVGLARQVNTPTKRTFNPISQKYENLPTGAPPTTKIVEEKKKLLVKNSPTFEPIDIFAFYMYPYTANDLDECYGVIELEKKPRWWILQQGKDEVFANTDNLNGLKPDTSDEFQWTIEQRLASDDLQSGDIKEIPYYTLFRYYGKFNWGTEDAPDEQDTFITTCQNGTLLELRKNQFYDQDIPFTLARLTELMNEIYSSGGIEPLQSLQYFLNDTMNQTFDSVSYSLNPIVVYDPGRVININSIVFAPGAMWAISDPGAVRLERAPDVSQVGYNTANVVKGIIEEAPGMQNVPLTGRKAATHIAAIQQEYSLPIIDLAENIENQCLSPWLQKAYNRIQQFVTDEEVFRAIGRNGMKFWKRLSPEVLVGDYHFFWRGSIQATNIHVKAQQMTSFAQLITPFIPFLQNRGVDVDLAYLMKRIWTEGLALDGGDKILKNRADDVSIDPQIENVMLSVGKFLATSSADIHEQHIAIHEPLTQHPDKAVRDAAIRHNQEHQFAIQQQQAAMQMPTQTGQSGPGQEGPGEVPGERQLESNQPVTPMRPH